MTNYTHEIIARSGQGYVTKKYRTPDGQEQFVIGKPNAEFENCYLIRIETVSGKPSTRIYDFVDNDCNALLVATADGDMVSRAQMIVVDAFEGRLVEDCIFRFWGNWENAPSLDEVYGEAGGV